MIMATRIHLFPFRTQKLSSSTAKVLDHPRSGRIASCRISIKNDRFQAENGHFSFVFAVFLKLRMYQKLEFQPSFIVDFSLLNCDFYHISVIIRQA